MPTDRELMQQALDALEGYARNCRCEGGGAPCDAAEALRARLAQPEPEVKWDASAPLVVHLHPAFQTIEALRARLAQPDLITPADVKQLARIEKLVEDVDPYTAPPQREWIGLTDEEITETLKRFGLGERAALAHAIEQALKEKNNA